MGVASNAAKENSSTVKKKSALNAPRTAKGAPMRASATSAIRHSSRSMDDAPLVQRAHSSTRSSSNAFPAATTASNVMSIHAQNARNLTSILKEELSTASVQPNTA